MSSLYRLVGSLLLTQVLSLSLPLAAQTEPAADPPSRVGRLGHTEGEVTFRPQRDETASPATTNWPLSSGAVLETGARSRAEAWVDSTTARLDEASRLEFSTIDDRQVLLDLNAGRLGLSVMEAEQAADLQVRLPDGRVRFAAAGRYRLDVLPDRSELTVFAGRASIEHDGGSTQLAAGNRATLFADGSLRVGEAERPDAFVHWVAERENATVANTARSHVSPYMTGYQDLDSYGDWSSNTEYGAVWMPRAVAADWAPYRFGRWAWVAPWGWTWIDAAPWGFAPFHYGRWVTHSGRWAWVPGRRADRPVYAPALVAWIGNPGWSVSFGFGAAPAVGWFPLAPREVYVPYYRYSPAYIRRINITHVHDVTIIERAARGGPPPHFAHRDSPRAVTVVPTRQLREGRPIGARDFQRIERRDLERAPAGGGRDWLAPTAEARRPWAGARPGQPAGPREAGPVGRPGPERRGDARQPVAAFGEAPNRRDAPAAAVFPRQPWSGNRQPGSVPPREARELPRNDAAPGFRRPETAPAPAVMQQERQWQRQREERGSSRPVAPAAAPFEAPAVRRGDAVPRPAVGAPDAVPSRAQPVPEMRRESREIMRPAPRQDEGRRFQRAEPDAQRPAMRGPDAGRERGDGGERPGRGSPRGDGGGDRGGDRGGERGQR